MNPATVGIHRWPPSEVVEECVLCGCAESEFLHEAVDRLHHRPGTFAFVRCAACSLVRLTPRPRPEHLGFYYPDDYYSFQPPEAESPSDPRDGLDPPAPEGSDGGVRARVRQAVLASSGYEDPEALPAPYRILIPILTRVFRERVFSTYPGFPEWVPDGRALDIGCGSGAFLRKLRFHGWEVHGVEVSELAARRAAASLPGATIWPGQVEDAPFVEESFDFVHISHVIEHMPDPVASLRAAVTLLKPGGTLFLETPNASAVNARWLGPYWFPWEAPRHLVVFTPATLVDLVRSVGLEVTKMDTGFDPHVHAFEDTYRVEESAGAPLSHRPRIRVTRRPRAVLLRMAARAHHRFDPLDGDNLRCWTRRAGGGR